MAYYALLHISPISAINNTPGGCPIIFKGEYTSGEVLGGFPAHRIEAEEIHSVLANLSQVDSLISGRKPVQITEQLYNELKDTIIKAQKIENIFSTSVESVYMQGIKNQNLKIVGK